MPAHQFTETHARPEGLSAFVADDNDPTLSEAAHDLANLLQILSSSLSLMTREVEQPDLVRARLATAMIGVSQCVSLSRALFAQPGEAADSPVMLQSLIETGRPLFELAAGPDVDIEILAPAKPL